MRKKLNKAIALALTAAMTFSMVSYASETDDMGEEVTMILGYDTPSLAPFYGQSGGLKYAFNTIYETLGIMDQRGEELTLVIAKSVEQVDDGQYEIEIWDNVYDTDGNHITAEDIVYCYETCGELTVFTNFLSAYDHMEQIDDYTVMLYMKEERVGALMSIMEGVPIVSKAAYEADPDSYIQTPKGTTGYVVTSFSEGYGFTCEWVGNWHDEGQAETISFAHTVKTINYIYITETSQVRMALENGEADVAYNVATDDLDYFAEADGFEVSSDIDNRVTQLLYNGSEGTPGADIHFRKAVAYAINREEINQFVYAGAAALPNAVSGIYLIDYNPDWDEENYYDYDVDMAIEELEQSTYNGETIEILMSNSDTLKSIGTLIVTYLEAIGITAEIYAVEDAVVENNAEDPTCWDLYLSPRGAEDYIGNMWKHFADQDAFGGTTQGFVKDDTLQEYFETMLATATYSQDLVNEATEYLNENCYVYTILQAPSYCVYNSDKIASIALNYKAYPLPNAFTYNY
ncbi:MAG: ABC transporter substrate-binding protein [Lachnospiraceae bacterium]|nr:ABC transporter substrate-binding protein [Lachnospiraceae bacterium]